MAECSAALGAQEEPLCVAAGVRAGPGQAPYPHRRRSSGPQFPAGQTPVIPKLPLVGGVSLRGTWQAGAPCSAGGGSPASERVGQAVCVPRKSPTPTPRSEPTACRHTCLFQLQGHSLHSTRLPWRYESPKFTKLPCNTCNLITGDAPTSLGFVVEASHCPPLDWLLLHGGCLVAHTAAPVHTRSTLGRGETRVTSRCALGTPKPASTKDTVTAGVAFPLMGG